MPTSSDACFIFLACLGLFLMVFTFMAALLDNVEGRDAKFFTGMMTGFYSGLAMIIVVLHHYIK